MKRYVLGFAFNGARVMLIKKNHPDWQAGKLNGLGGHIEPGEEPVDAMVREFQEECGLITSPKDWELYAIMKREEHDCFECYVFKNFASMLNNFQTTTDEEVDLYIVDRLPSNIIDNLPWLIDLAYDPYPKLATITY